MNDVTFRITRQSPYHLVGTVHCVATADRPDGNEEEGWVSAEKQVRSELVRMLWGAHETLLERLQWALKTWPAWALSQGQQTQINHFVDDIEDALQAIDSRRGV